MTVPATEAVTGFFWVMTLQRGSAGGAPATATVSGPARYPSGYSRAGAYADCLAAARRKLGVPDGAPSAVLFFSLEPEALP